MLIILQTPIRYIIKTERNNKHANAILPSIILLNSNPYSLATIVMLAESVRKVGHFEIKRTLLFENQYTTDCKINNECVAV